MLHAVVVYERMSKAEQVACPQVQATLSGYHAATSSKLQTLKAFLEDTSSSAYVTFKDSQVRPAHPIECHSLFSPHCACDAGSDKHDLASSSGSDSHISIFTPGSWLLQLVILSVA